MDLTPLKNVPDKCKSTDPRVVDWHDRLVATLATIRERLGAYLDDTAWKPVEKHYRSGRELVERNYYRVGFIGRSQVGKSSTYNHVLGIVEKILGEKEYLRIAPATSGQQKATTASVTRLRKANDNSCRVRYLSPGQHRARCETLFPEVAGVPKEASVTDALKGLNALSSPHMRVDEEAAFLAMKSTQMDREKLQQYLQSYETYGKDYVEVASPPRIDSHPYDERRTFVNHSDAKGRKSQMLIRDVELGFVTDRIPADLELIDLPGLGASLWDDQITSELVAEGLDAAFVFISAVENIEPTDLRRALEGLHRYFRGAMRDRVWVVVTKVDGLTDDAMRGGVSGKTVFGNLRDVIVNTNEIPEDQVVFVFNKLYGKYAERDAGGRIACRIPKDALELAVGTSVGEGNRMVIPDAWGPLPNAWKEKLQLIAEGCGIDTLFKIISNDVPIGVRKRVHEDIARRLDKGVRETMLQILKVRGAASGGTSRVAGHANSWRAQLQQLTTLLSRTEVFEEPAKRLQEALEKRFRFLCRDGIHVVPAQLPREHQNWFADLQNIARERLTTDVIPSVYGALVERLRTAAQVDGIDDVPIVIADASHEHDGESTFLKSLERFSTIDAVHLDGVETVLQQLTAKLLFGEDQKRRPFVDTNSYRKYALEWLPVWTRRAVHAVATRVRSRLATVNKQLLILSEISAASEQQAAKPLFESAAAMLEQVGPFPKLD